MTTAGQVYSRSPLPLYLQVAAIFRRNIQRDLWQRGSQVPALDSLVETLGVSRATVRQAFGLLEREGLIHRSRGSGTYVNHELPKTISMTLPKTWAETVALSNSLGTQTLTESNNDVALPSWLGMKCPYEKSGHFHYWRRVHTTSAGPFCYTEVYLANDIYDKHPERYRHRTVAPILDSLHGTEISHAEQLLTIIEAGSDSAEALHLPLATPVAELRRYACIGERVIYFTRLEVPTRYVQITFDLMEQR